MADIVEFFDGGDTLDFDVLVANAVCFVDGRWA